MVNSYKRQLLRMTPIFIGLISLISPPSILAQSLGNGDLNSIYNDTVWYQPSGISSCPVNVPISLSGNDNIQKAFNFFVREKGLTAIQSAAIVGNYVQESHVDPTATNEIGAHGIAQWTPGSGRLALLEKFAQQNNLIEDDLVTQLEFSWSELTTGNYQKTGNELKNSDNIPGATNIIFAEYEGPGDNSLSDRIIKAQSIYDSYGSSAGGISFPPSSSGGCTRTSGSGQDTQYVDGFTIYSQYDPQWVNLAYASSTIGVSGCGPSAMAMIITALTGVQVTPDITAAYAASRGLYVPGAGSSWNIGPVLAEHWGLNSTLVGADIAQISAVLQSGGLVIAVGKGPLPFTSGGHFIVIRGVAADGKWLVGDSAHSGTSSQEWDPTQILDSIQSNGSSGSIYAITK